MRFFLLAGEPSGDKLGAALMSGLKELLPDVEFCGVGGPLMEAEGMESLFPMAELSLTGLTEILPKYFHLRSLLYQAVDEVIAQSPDALITIDAPEFSLRLANRARRRNPDLHTVHYVAPTVWAWRPGRAEKMAPDIDQVLALLPFEPPYMEAAGMRCDFVGHPVVAEPRATLEQAEAFRQEHAISPEETLLLALPGSRRGEIATLAPVFAETLRTVTKQRPDFRIVVPTVAARAGLMSEAIADWPGDPILLDPRGRDDEDYLCEKRAAFRAADLALAASGTVSLELAASDTPMVIGYDGPWLSRIYIQRMLLTDTVTLVNLVSETRAVPEFLAGDCRPEKMSEALLALFDDAGAQREAMRVTMERLGSGMEAPGLRAARAVLHGLSWSGDT